MYDLVIIGGGAASQSAAMYAIGKQIHFLMICEKLGGRVEDVAPTEHDFTVGKMLVHYDAPDAQDEEHHLIGSSAVHLFERQLTTQRGRILVDQVTALERDDDGFRVVTEQHGVRSSRTVIVATGAMPREPGLPGKGAAHVRILGHAATTHTRSVAGKIVAVIGATEQSLYAAAEMAQLARHLYLLTPTTNLLDSPIGAALGQLPNIQILARAQIIDVVGTGAVEELVVEHAGRMHRIGVDLAFVDSGLQPRSKLVQSLVELDEQGFIQVDDQNATSVPGLFAAGDVTNALGEQVLIAIGEGARAAVSAHRYLLERPLARQANR